MTDRPQDHGKQHSPTGGGQDDLRIRNHKSRASRAEAKGDWKTAARQYARALQQRETELALINKVQEGLSARTDMQAIYDLVGDQIQRTFNAQVVMISEYDPDTDKIHHRYAIERGRYPDTAGWQPIDASRAKVVQSKKPVMINEEEINALLEEEAMSVVPGTETPKTWLGVPWLVGGEARGIVSLQNLDTENAFTKADIELLSTLTNSMSLSLENARLFHETQRLLDQMEREMALARHAQTSILPKSAPSREGYDFGSKIVPARAVGGDFYDFLPLGEDRLYITIGDISDKGLPAALFMALTFSLVRAETRRSQDQGQILENVNQVLLRMDTEMFVTLSFCILDFKTGTLQIARAGHLPPLVVDNCGDFVNIPVGEGQPLGMFEEVQIDHQLFTIPEGGLVLFYSDGLHEAVDPEGNAFGLQRVRDILTTHCNDDPESICEELWKAVRSHAGPNLQQDDFTTVIIKRDQA